MISIITINYNNKKGLKDTIESIINQSFDDYEYIVIDGNSTDGSKELLNEYNDKIHYSISEPDSGVYEAMNKGVKVSKGNYLLFLNSGDTLYNEKVLENVSKELVDNIDIYYGDLHFIKDKENRIKSYPDKLSFSYFIHKSIGHPASFIKRALFDRVFYYNEDLKIVSDWEFFICAICKFNATYRHLNLIVSNFDFYGMSTMPGNKHIIEKESQKVLNDHFSFLLDEYKETQASMELLQTNRFKMLAELEKSTFAKKLNSMLLRIFLRIFRNKKLKDL